MELITYENKSDRRTTDIPVVNKVSAADMNQIKKVVNAIVEKLDLVRIPTSVILTSGSFDGNAYTDSRLVDKTAMVDFNLFTNDNSGTLKKVDTGYTFNSTTGTITAEASNYRLEIYVPLI